MEKLLRLKNGTEVKLPIPESGEGPSCFLVGLPKAGSTLLNNLMNPLSVAAGLQYYPLFNRLKSMGLDPIEIDDNQSYSIFDRDGYCYGGFRGLPGSITLPKYADGRTIVLVRDPRDMLTSLYFSVAFSHRPPPVSEENKLKKNFDRQRNSALSSDINSFVIERAKVMLKNYKDIDIKLTDINSKLYRYEDVIFEKHSWTIDMLKYLNLDVGKEAIDRVVARNDVIPKVEDVQAHVRSVAPGDHKKKLSNETIDRLNEMLKPVLTKYAYA